MALRSSKILILIAALVLVLFAVAFVILPLPGTVSILMYHFVGSSEDARESKNFVSRESFERQMAFLRIGGYHVISLDEFYAIHQGQRKSRGKEVVITFDDGNYTFAREAYPVLKKYDFPVAVFVVSENMKQKLHGSMTVEVLKELAASPRVTLGSHTKTHPFLSRLDLGKIQEELEGSKNDLETLLGVPIHYLAYPYGDFDVRVAEVAKKAGYRLAFTTSAKKLRSSGAGSYGLMRVKITRSSDNLFVHWFKASGIYGTFKEWRSRWGKTVESAS